MIHRRRNRRLRLIRKYLRILMKEREAICQLNDYQKSLIPMFHSFADNVIHSSTSSCRYSEQYSMENPPSLRWKLLSRGYLVNPAVVSIERVVPKKSGEEPVETTMESQIRLQSAR